MDYTHLGRTGLKVRRPALGPMNFGELTDETAGSAIMNEAIPRAPRGFIGCRARLVASRSVVTAAISGPRTVEQLRENRKAPSLHLAGDALAELDRIWPGPGGAEGVAYAW